MRPSQGCINTERLEKKAYTQSGISVFGKATTTGKETNLLSHQVQQVVYEVL